MKVGKIAVIGTGHIGLVTGACFAEYGHEVVCADSDPNKIESLRRRKMPFHEPGMEEVVLRNLDAGRLSFTDDVGEAIDAADVLFICVGTPQGPGGAADLSMIESVSRTIATRLRSYKLIVEKSTVPVRTGQRLFASIERHLPLRVEFDVASNPEFLREGSAVHDALHPERIVVGVASPRAEAILRALYEPFQAPMIVTDLQSAELIKHASNSFLAMKISYINAVAMVCEEAGADVEEVARGMGMDSRIGRPFLNAGLGYGGYCFPKDVEAFQRIAQELGCDFPLLPATQRINLCVRERFLRKIERELWVVKGKTIGFLGLSFKPDTDDLRESPALAVARALQDQGARLRVYDPQAMPFAAPHLEGATFCSDAYDAATGADCLAIATEWKEFRELDLGRIREAMTEPIVIDGRNLFDPDRMQSLGFVYRCMGRGRV